MIRRPNGAPPGVPVSSAASGAAGVSAVCSDWIAPAAASATRGLTIRERLEQRRNRGGIAEPRERLARARANLRIAIVEQRAHRRRIARRRHERHHGRERRIGIADRREQREATRDRRPVSA